MAKFELIDDGTLDTVVRCPECSAEERYTYETSDDEINDPANAIVQSAPGDYWILRGDARQFATEQGAETARDARLYAAYVAECIDEATNEHSCPIDDDDDESRGPQDDDLTTSDHRQFFYHGGPGRMAFELQETKSGHYRICKSRAQVAGQFATVERAIRAFMQSEQYWPNCWFISDHGNAHLMDLGRV